MSDNPPETTLSPDYHVAIGVITVNGALMDQLVDNAIWVIMKVPPERGAIITKLLLSTARKIDFLRDLVQPMFADDAIKAEFHDVFSKLKSAQANRSKVVHAKWVVKHPGQSIHIEVPASDETQPEIEPMPLTQLQHYGSEIAQAHTALENFFLRVELKSSTTGHHTWPPRQDGRSFREK